MTKAKELMDGFVCFKETCKSFTLCGVPQSPLRWSLILQVKVTGGVQA